MNATPTSVAISSGTPTATFTYTPASTGTKTISISDIALNGGDASNYNLQNTTATTTADITRAPLTITANNASKVFGTTLTFAGTEFTTSPMVGGQTVGSVTLTSAGAAATERCAAQL